MSFIITIPELSNMGVCPEELYHSLVVLLSHEIRHLHQKYPSESIADINAYPLYICERIIKQARTIDTVITVCKDYVSANALIRNLADSISTLILIYKKSDNSELYLRHYLYVRDGLCQRLSQLPKEIEKDEYISDEEFRLLQHQVLSAKTNYEEAYHACEQEIKKLAIYAANQDKIDQLLKKNQWKFKNIDECKPYKWIELYGLLELKANSFFSNLSEFVHGLSTSNLQINDEYETYYPLYCIAICLLGKLKECIETIYMDDMKELKPKMKSIFKDPELSSTYFYKFVAELNANINNIRNNS